MSVRNVIDCLEEEGSGWLNADIHLASPEDGYCSDEDSGGEEEGPSINNLSRKQLLANCELHLQSNEMDEETNVISNAEELANLNKPKTAAKNKSSKYQNSWEEHREQTKNLLRAQIDAFEPPENEYFTRPDTLNKVWTPVELFSLFFTPEMLEFICDMTNQYAAEADASNWDLLRPAELKCFIAMIMYTSYVRIPSIRMYWEETLDVGQPIIRNAMSRNRFQAILRYIHLLTMLQ